MSISKIFFSLLSLLLTAAIVTVVINPLISRGKLATSSQGQMVRPQVSAFPSPSALGQVITQDSTVARPQILRIPKLSISTEIEWVALDDQQRMDVPKNNDQVAWYELGARPGEVGNAVVAGHYDTPTGTPAVFFELEELTVGDEVIIIDEAGQSQRFQVTDTAIYEDAAFPIAAVFGATSKRRLNLITCTGDFDPANRNYLQRRVIYTELVI